MPSRGGIPLNTMQYAQWEVVWSKNGRVVRHDCDVDLGEALRVRDRVTAAGRDNITLRCKNFGFPPPPKFRQREEVRVIRRRGKRVRVKVRITPMKQLNEKGIYWCSYCMQMRRFVISHGFHHGDIWVPQDRFGCPTCGVGVDNHMIAKFNPRAPQIELRLRSTRTGKKKGRRRRTRKEE